MLPPLLALLPLMAGLAGAEDAPLGEASFSMPRIKMEKSVIPEADKKLKPKTGAFVYDIAGHYVTFIADERENEVLFVDFAVATVIEQRQKNYNGGNQSAIGSQARIHAVARLTKETAKELKGYHAEASKKKGATADAFSEPGGVLWIEPSSRELHAWNCGACAVGKNAFMPADMFKESWWENEFLGKAEVKGEIFALWHGHPGDSYAASGPTDIAGEDLFGNQNLKANPLFKKYFTDGWVGLITNAEVVTVFATNSKYSREKPFVAAPKAVVSGMGYDEKGVPHQYGSFLHKDLSLKLDWRR